MPIILISVVGGFFTGLVAGSELKKAKKLEFRIPVFTIKSEKN